MHEGLLDKIISLLESYPEFKVENRNNYKWKL